MYLFLFLSAKAKRHQRVPTPGLVRVPVLVETAEQSIKSCFICTPLVHTWLDFKFLAKPAFYAHSINFSTLLNKVFESNDIDSFLKDKIIMRACLLSVVCP